MVDTYGRKETFEALAKLRRDDGGGVAEETVAELAAATRDAFARSSIDDEATMLEMIRQVKNQTAAARREGGGGAPTRARGGGSRTRRSGGARGGDRRRGEDGRGGARGGGGEGAGGDHPKRIRRGSRAAENAAEGLRRAVARRRVEARRTQSDAGGWVARGDARRRAGGRGVALRGDARRRAGGARRRSTRRSSTGIRPRRRRLFDRRERSSQTASRTSPRKTGVSSDASVDDGEGAKEGEGGVVFVARGSV